MINDLSLDSQTMDCQTQIYDIHNQNLILSKSLEAEDSLVSYLKKYYPKSQHISTVINGCFRCHQFHTIRLFTQIRLNQFSDIKQPKISNFFNNQAFINLESFQKWKIEGQIPQKFPSLVIQPIPKDLNKILDELYVEHGYIPNFERMLLFFPSYLSKHIKLYSDLFENHNMHHPGIYFLGICAAAELGSLYFMTRFIKKFQRSGGSMDWLTDRKYPKKYEILLHLNRKLSRSFWEIDTPFIERVLTQGELNHRQFAFICFVLSYTHQMSTISLSMGIKEEQNYDILEMKSIRQMIENYQEQNYITSHKQNLSKVYNSLQNQEDNIQRNSGKTRKSIKREERRLESQTQIQGYMKEIAKDLTQQQLYQHLTHYLSPLLPVFKPLERRQQQLYPPIDYSEYNFEFDAYPMLKSLTNQAADLFFDLLKYSEDMTLYNFGNEKCLNNSGTKAFRRAIAYYSKNLCGFTHLDYDYKNNYKKYLTMPLKFQLRLMTLSPLHISKQVITEISSEGGQMACFDNAYAATLIANTKMSMVLMMVTRAWSGTQQQ